MLICDIWLFDWYFPQFRKSDMSKYRYLEVFQRVPSIQNIESRQYLQSVAAVCILLRSLICVLAHVLWLVCIVANDRIKIISFLFV